MNQIITGFRSYLPVNTTAFAQGFASGATTIVSIARMAIPSASTVFTVGVAVGVGLIGSGVLGWTILASNGPA